MKVYPIDISTGVTKAILDKLEVDLKLQAVPGFRKEVENMYTLFRECDATQLEINPWAVDPKNRIFSVDAKINIDDNAKFRQS